jgi:NAD(P)-dependent dehydrogenase (short-subunit alcohol dehydrogenase family)
MTETHDSPVIVITGASAGIGAAAARAFTALGWTVHGTGRSRAKLDAVAASCEGGSFTGHVADFASLAQVRALGEELLALPRIDVLANNAGGTWPKRITTEDGHEQTIQVNHLAPFLLTHLLQDQVSGGRVITTASIAHHLGRMKPEDLDFEHRRFSEQRVYGTSKLANVLFADELQRRWGSPALSASYHPGAVASEFGRDTPLTRWAYGGPLKRFFRSNEFGAATMVFLATAPREALVPGGYYANRKVGHKSRQARDSELAGRLWDESAKILGL